MAFVNRMLDGFPPRQDWLYSLRTFFAAMVALYFAMKMQMPRPYWAMATVYVVSSPFIGATTSKAIYRGLGTFVGSAAAVVFVPLFAQAPLLLAAVIAIWTGAFLFVSLHLRTANSYALMLAGYTLPLIALPVVDNPGAVFDVASARFQEICLGVVVAAVSGSIFWPRRLAPVLGETSGQWFINAIAYSNWVLSRGTSGGDAGNLRASMVSGFNSLEMMIGQLPHEGTTPEVIRNLRDLRGRMLHYLPTADALADAIAALAARSDEMSKFQPLIDSAQQWLDGAANSPPRTLWARLHKQIEACQPAPGMLHQPAQLLLSNALFRLGEWVDLWQDLLTLQDAVEHQKVVKWHAVFRHWTVGATVAFFDRRMMVFSTVSAIVATFLASMLWIATGWAEGAGAVIMVAVACSFFAALDEPAPQIYRFFFWTVMAVVLSSGYLFWVLPNLHDFSMLVLVFAVPFLMGGALSVQPRFSLGMMLTLVNGASFISLDTAYDANILTFLNSNLAGPAGLLFALIWSLLTRPFGVNLAQRRLTHACWKDIANLRLQAPLTEHRVSAMRMMDRLMQLAPRLRQSGQDITAPLRDVRVALCLLDLLAFMPRLSEEHRSAVREVINGVRDHFRMSERYKRRISIPTQMLRMIDRACANLALGVGDDATNTQSRTLYALSGLRLALLPVAEAVVDPSSAPELPTQGLDGAPL